MPALLAIVIRYRAVLAPDVGDLVPAGHGKCSKFGAQGNQIRVSCGKVSPKHI